jgi:hypothetical protein
MRAWLDHTEERRNMHAHPLSDLDFRPYAGQLVIIAHVWQEPMPAYHKRRFYILGPLTDDLPAHVKAIIQDDGEEGAEQLYVAIVNEDGAVEQHCPLVVFDDQERLRYGADYLHVIIKTGQTSPAVTVRGVHFDE